MSGRGPGGAGGDPGAAPRHPLIFPAIDLRGGRCVRLIRGQRGAEIDYSGDPVEAATRWVAGGAERIHAIDLGGAFGEPDNREAVIAIARAVAVPVQAGGGLRDEEAVERVLAGGVARAILGTRALQDTDFLARLLAHHGPARIVLALDVAASRGAGEDPLRARVRTRGWEAESGFDLAGGMDLARRSGIEHVLITATDRDGTLAGPAVDVVRAALDAGGPSVVAAGGIGKLDDIRALLDLRHPRLEGVVVGRALWEGAVSLPEAVALSKEYIR